MSHAAADVLQIARGLRAHRAQHAVRTVLERTAGLACAVASCVAWVLPLAAQERPARTDTLAPVTVTVLRTPFDVTHAPVDVARVPPRQATVARPGFALDEVLGHLGGVQVDNRLNFALGERISIRGVGARTQFGVRGVRVIVDDIPATLADGQTQLNNVDLGSLGDAEVIRGPASSLYGNGSGGVIVLQSRAAPAGSFVPTVRLMRGSDALTRVQVGAGGTDGSATYLLNADRLDYGGYRDHSSARNAHFNGVGTYAWDRVALKVVANAVQYDAENPGGLSDSLLQVDRRMAYTRNVTQRTGERGAQQQVGASSHIRLGSSELRLSGYALHRALDNPIPPRIIALGRLAGGARAALALTRAGTRGAVTGIVGAETDLQRDDRRNYVNVNGARGALVLDQLEHVRSASPFAQVTAVAGRATLLGGVRYDQFRFAADDRLVNSTNPDDSGVRWLHATSPSLGLTYDALTALSIYGNLAAGFQTPTTTELANRASGAGGFNPDLQPERVHSREAGVKGRSSFTSYQLSLYHMRIDNELIPFEVPAVPGRQFYRNAGAATHRGVDADIAVVATPWLLVTGSYGYTDARFAIYTVGATSYAGKRVPGVSPHIATVSAQLGDPGARFVAIEERLQSATPANDGNTASSPAYAVTNLRGEARFQSVTIFGGAGNLFGRDYNTSVTVNAAGGRYFEPAARRTAYLGVGLAPR